MKKNLLIIGLIVALVVCIFFLLQPDKDHDTHTDQHASIVANHDTIDAHGVDYRHIVDSLSISGYRKDSIITSLKQGQATTRKQLDLKSAEVRNLAAIIWAANQDAALNPKIDSLVNEINNLTFLLGQYESYADSINNVSDSLKINYEATVKEKDKRIAELQMAYDALFKSYQQLFADSQVMAKDLKRQKLKTKIVGVLGAAAAVLGFIK